MDLLLYSVPDIRQHGYLPSLPSTAHLLYHNCPEPAPHQLFRRLGLCGHRNRRDDPVTDA